jgi:hypothetical protein
MISTLSSLTLTRTWRSCLPAQHARQLIAIAGAPACAGLATATSKCFQSSTVCVCKLAC